MPFAIEAASRPDSEVNAIGSETETLEISTATAGAATERRLRTAAGVGAFGDCENRRVSSICTRFANRRLCSPKGRCACSQGIAVPKPWIAALEVSEASVAWKGTGNW